MAQMPSLVPKEVEVQRLKKIYIMVICLGSIAASVEVDNSSMAHCIKRQSETVLSHLLTGGSIATS